MSGFLQYLGNNRSVLHGARLSSPAVTDVEATVETNPQLAAEKAKHYATDEAVNVLGSITSAGLAARAASKAEKAATMVANADKVLDTAYDTANKVRSALDTGEAQLKHLKDVVTAMTLQGAPQQKIIEAQRAYSNQLKAVQQLRNQYQLATKAVDGASILSRGQSALKLGNNAGIVTRNTNGWRYPYKPEGAVADHANAIKQANQLFGEAGRLEGQSVFPTILSGITNTATSAGYQHGGKINYLEFFRK